MPVCQRYLVECGMMIVLGTEAKRVSWKIEEMDQTLKALSACMFLRLHAHRRRHIIINHVSEVICGE